MSTTAPPSKAKPNTIGENIRLAREAKGITQLALAHLIGWHGDDAGAQICRYELGKQKPHLATLLLIAAALEVGVNELCKPVAKKKK